MRDVGTSGKVDIRGDAGPKIQLEAQPVLALFRSDVAVSRVHMDDEVGVRREEGHLAFRISLVSAIAVGFNEFADRHCVLLRTEPLPSRFAAKPRALGANMRGETYLRRWTSALPRSLAAVVWSKTR